MRPGINCRFQYILFFVAILFLFPVFVTAQSESYGTWTSVSYEKDLKKLDIEAETELRTIYMVSLIDRWSLGISADYKLNKYLKVGAGYQFMNSLEYKTDDNGLLISNFYVKNYFIRNRFNLSGTGKYKLDDFSFSLRERVQVTTKEERERTDGTIDDYKVNPAWVWRNRFQLSYNIPHCKITPSASVESFYQLNNPDGNTFDNMRYILSFEYKINKHNYVELYGVVNSELDSDDASGKYILGASYKFSY
ncbi:MAG: DUF2490 domain-containing protein [Paludibacter sp.]|nr:DUF2490 domain-containing protein [Paludibacter sp.]